MINLRFKDVNLPCNNHHNNSSNDKNDKKELVCNSICIVEPPYSIRSLKCINGTVKNSSAVYLYKSLTSQIHLNFINRLPYGHAFTAEYLITSKSTKNNLKIRDT